MSGFGLWLRRLGAKINTAVSRFMEGRYGYDRLNLVILLAGVAATLLAEIFRRLVLLSAVLQFLSFLLMGLAIFRALSRNTYRRYRENRRYLLILDQLKDRQHRYFDCPRCHQSVRVPRGKGKIAITCPKCGEKFVRKT